jgi:chloramphenicol-sensitive protein RarD
VATAVPLLFFAAATRRVPLSVIGLLQYVAPVLQFLVGVGVRHEKLPGSQFVGFALVWVALTVLGVSEIAHRRRIRAATQGPPGGEDEFAALTAETP